MRRALLVGIDDYPGAPLAGCAARGRNVARTSVNAISSSRALSRPNVTSTLASDPSTVIPGWSCTPSRSGGCSREWSSPQGDRLPSR